ncbi:hypothetical protein [Nocardioides solisilvae]|uniref:hypothetical protein n=1 Tax=Nocardioides solisilvae TaxID=1542435 RepID=UPI000D74DEE9|nr:hypothetical protein [Nocardioides solisilvae]
MTRRAARPARRGSRLAALAAATLSLALLGACSQDAEEAGATDELVEPSASAGSSDAGAGKDHHDAEAVGGKKLRPGERRVTVSMDEAYTPASPTSTGTDDYRCFLIDPQLEKPAFLTGTHVLPGNPEVVHHVILFKVEPDEVERAEELDAGEEGPGWTCFGGSGLQTAPGEALTDSDWLAAWAPGGEETVTKPGHGVRLDKGSRVIMQVHYNLLAGPQPDVSATQLRLSSRGKGMTGLETLLLPAPVEMPCREGHDDSRLCDREASLLDLRGRIGPDGDKTANLLHQLCGMGWEPGEHTECLRTFNEPMTIHGVAGHMHLLGKEIKIELNPGTPRARTVMDIPVWDFDDQGGIPIDPVRLRPGDQVKVSCRHSQELRDRLPAFEGQPDRYVVWGDGTTDEMCLGMLTVSKP